MRKYNKLVILGTGNVAHALTQVLRDSGRTILQVWGRNEEAAKKLGNMLHVSFTSEMDELDPNADAYIICVKDDAIASVAAQFPFANKPLIHTAWRSLCMIWLVC
ncbi:MAG: NAD(P)-binding domain-containing protein [Sediminibacterium sp.]|nr:NAD(P)-binding domain-containing protein [Sediminibacterium sp.]